MRNLRTNSWYWQTERYTESRSFLDNSFIPRSRSPPPNHQISFRQTILLDRNSRTTCHNRECRPATSFTILASTQWQSKYPEHNLSNLCFHHLCTFLQHHLIIQALKRRVSQQNPFLKRPRIRSHRLDITK